MKDFKNGPFQKLIIEFIKYKRSLGYAYTGSLVYQLKEINNLITDFYNKNSLNTIYLSKECMEFILEKKESYQQPS